jgi:hypothetical protein
MTDTREGRTFRVREIPESFDKLQLARVLKLLLALGYENDVSVHSLATSISPLVYPKQVATVTFSKTPKVFEDGQSEWVLSGQGDGTQYLIRVDLHHLGFTPLNEPRNHTLE